MKISKLFHWLYATLLFLPLLVTPIFALYTTNKNAVFEQVAEVPSSEVVYFNQLVEDDLIVEDFTTEYQYRQFNIQDIPTCTSGDIVYYRFWYKNNSVGQTYFTFGSNNQQPQGYSYSLVNTSGQYVYAEKRVSLNSVFDEYKKIYLFYFNTQTNTTTEIININFFNLTQMFGAGNEPSIQQFNSWYPASYYEYTLNRKELLYNGTTITYSDTDIGSQFIYTLYNSTDKYLNFDSVLNLYQLDEWIKLNVFNGNAPLIWTIAWHYLEYWLILSIYWLCFDVIMYVPLLAHRWLDKASLE